MFCAVAIFTILIKKTLYRTDLPNFMYRLISYKAEFNFLMFQNYFFFCLFSFATSIQEHTVCCEHITMILLWSSFSNALPKQKKKFFFNYDYMHATPLLHFPTALRISIHMASETTRIGIICCDFLLHRRSLRWIDSSRKTNHFVIRFTLLLTFTSIAFFLTVSYSKVNEKYKHIT